VQVTGHSFSITMLLQFFFISVVFNDMPKFQTNNIFKNMGTMWVTSSREDSVVMDDDFSTSHMSSDLIM